MKIPMQPNDTPDSERVDLEYLLGEKDTARLLEVQRILRQCGIHPNDPMHPAIATMVHCHKSLTPIPENLKALSNDIKLHLVTLQSYSGQQLQECRDVAYDIKVAANRLSKQLAVSSSQTHNSALLPFLWAFFGSVCGSAVVLLLQRVF